MENHLNYEFSAMCFKCILYQLYRGYDIDNTYMDKKYLI